MNLFNLNKDNNTNMKENANLIHLKIIIEIQIIFLSPKKK